MNKRLSDRIAAELMADLSHGDADRDDQEIVRTDWLRSRNAEIEKDAQIKALADALGVVRRPLTQLDVLSDATWAQIDAALKSVGRL